MNLAVQELLVHLAALVVYTLVLALVRGLVYNPLLVRQRARYCEHYHILDHRAIPLSPCYIR